MPSRPSGEHPGVACGRKLLRSAASAGHELSRLALNVDMDLTPFTHINPCGYAGLEATQLKDLGVAADWDAVSRALGAMLQERL